MVFDFLKKKKENISDIDIALERITQYELYDDAFLLSYSDSLLLMKRVGARGLFLPIELMQSFKEKGMALFPNSYLLEWIQQVEASNVVEKMEDYVASCIQEFAKDIAYVPFGLLHLLVSLHLLEIDLDFARYIFEQISNVYFDSAGISALHLESLWCEMNPVGLDSKDAMDETVQNPICQVCHTSLQRMVGNLRTHHTHIAQSMLLSIIKDATLELEKEYDPVYYEGGRTLIEETNEDDIISINVRDVEPKEMLAIMRSAIPVRTWSKDAIQPHPLFSAAFNRTAIVDGDIETTIKFKKMLSIIETNPLAYYAACIEYNP